MNWFSNLSIKQSIIFSTITTITFSLAIISYSYYQTFSDTTDELLNTQSSEINKQIVSNYDNYINNVIQVANYIQLETTNLDIAKSLKELENIFTSSFKSQSDIESIILFDEFGEGLIKNSQLKVINEDISNKDWFIKAINNTNIFNFSSPHIEDAYINGAEEVITVTKYIDYYENGIKKNGVLLIDINFSKIRNISTSMNLGKGGHILIIDESNRVVYSSNPSCLLSNCESYDLTIDNILGGFDAEIDSVKMFGDINTLDGTRWRIVSFLNVENVEIQKVNMIRILIIIFLISIGIATIFSFILSYSISKPLSKLKKIMLEIEKGNFYTKANISGQKEIVLVANSFNEMITHIRELMDKVIKEQKGKRKSELQALQNQINPHFLYNTLDSIIWLAENNDNEKVVETVVALSRLFRISLSKGNNFIPLLEEIEHVKNYLKIQIIRYPNKFKYYFDINEEVKDLKVMKLIVQPLVENAIYHGVRNLDEIGYIKISSYIKDEFLIIDVENSGYGITEDKINQIYKRMKDEFVSGGVGVRNVYQRLKLYYGEFADLSIESVLDEKTIVSIKIPLTEVKKVN